MWCMVTIFALSLICNVLHETPLWYFKGSWQIKSHEVSIHTENTQIKCYDWVTHVLSVNSSVSYPVWWPHPGTHTTCCPSLISTWVLCGQCWQLDIPSSIRLLKARGFNLLVHTVWACCASWRLFMWQSTKVTGQQSVRTWGFQLWSKWAWQQTFHLAICLPSASKATQSQKCLVTEVL